MDQNKKNKVYINIGNMIQQICFIQSYIKHYFPYSLVVKYLPNNNSEEIDPVPKVPKVGFGAFI